MKYLALAGAVAALMRVISCIAEGEAFMGWLLATLLATSIFIMEMTK